MDWLVQLGIWSAGAVIVVGIIQWAKGLFPKVPKVAWAAMLPAISLGAGLAGGGPWIWNGLGIWAISQIGYELIVQAIKKQLEKGKV